jgi:DNA-binding beta-propeller fold protein YncE
MKFRKTLSFLLVISLFLSSLLMYPIKILASAPTIVTLPIGVYTGASARLEASITSTGGSAILSRGFEYGPTTSYGTTVTQSGSDAYDDIKYFVYDSNFGSFAETHSVGIDSLGNVYASNWLGGQIQKYDSGGTLVTSWAVDQSVLAYVDPSDNVWGIDYDSSTVYKYDSDGNLLMTLGSPGSGDGQFSGPRGLAVDSDGNIWVADTGNSRIQKFDPSGNFLLKVVGFSSIYDIAVDSSNNVYTVLLGGTIKKYNSSGTYIITIGSNGSGNGQFNSPRRLSFDSNDNMYVADAGNARVQILDSSGNYLSSFTIFEGSNNFFGLDVTPDGNTLYVADTINNRVQKFIGNNKFSTNLSGLTCGGTYYARAFATNVDGTTYGSQVNITLDSTLGCKPTVSTSVSSSITTSSATLSGEITNGGNLANTIRGFQYGTTNSYGLESNEYGDFGSSGIFMSQFGLNGSGDGEFEWPFEITIDNDDNIYIADRDNDRIQKFDSDFNFILKFGTSGSGNGQFGQPVDLDIDSLGNIYVVDPQRNRVQKFTSEGVYITKWGTSGSGDGQFDQPYGIAIDDSDNVYVVDRNNARVQKFTSEGVYVSQFGANGSGDGEFQYPRDIAFDSLGNIYVSEKDGHRVQKFTSEGVYVSQFGTNGSGDGEFDEAFGLAIDTEDNIYVVDRQNHRVQKFDSDGVYVLQFGTNGSGDGEFDYPHAIAIDSNGDLYVVDRDNNRVQKFVGNGLYTRTITGLSCGTTYNYRAYSTNSEGTSYGSDTTFTTSACATTASASGSSAGSRAQNLFAMGKIEEAKKIVQDYPNAINEITNINTKTQLSNTTNTTTNQITKKLVKGTKDNQVKTLQTILNKVLNLKLNPDGSFGKMTKDALIQFQKAHNLTPDGVVGPKTRGILNGLL